MNGVATRVWLAAALAVFGGFGTVAASHDYPQRYTPEPDGVYTGRAAFGPTFSPDGKAVLFGLLDAGRPATLRTAPAKVTAAGALGAALALRPELRLVGGGAAYSPDGRRIAFVADTAPRDSEDPRPGLYVADADGTDAREVVQLSGVADSGADPVFSPDGKRLAYVDRPIDGSVIWVVRAGGSAVGVEAPERLTALDADSRSPAFSPDGERIVFAAQLRSGAELYVMDADGGGKKRLTTNRQDDRDPSFSPDGRRIVYVTSDDADRADIAVMDADGSGKRRLTPLDPDLDVDAAFSPDGRRIAFVSDRGGARDVWIMDADGRNPHRLTNVSEAITESAAGVTR